MRTDISEAYVPRIFYDNINRFLSDQGTVLNFPFAILNNSRFIQSLFNILHIRNYIFIISFRYLADRHSQWSQRERALGS